MPLAQSVRQPNFSKKYCWTHVKCAHEGSACNNKVPKHQDIATFSNKSSGSTYGCTWQGGSINLMMPNTYHKINLIQQTNNFFVDPPPQIFANSDTGATAHYFAQADAHALVDVQPTKMGPRVRLPDNSTMDPEQVGHLPLALPPAVTETMYFRYWKINP